MSSPWNGLLEALHSALIDELNERFPDEKPALGLPLRQNGYAPPETAREILLFRVTIGGVDGNGVAFLSASHSGMNPQQIWNGMMTRLKAEFQRRGIAPNFEKLNPGETQNIARSVWIPIELRGNWHLGIGR